MDDRLRALLGSLTLEEKASLTGGDDMWHVPAVRRVGLGRLKVSDGPSGVRGVRHTGGGSASFPCGTALAATWDPRLVEAVGRALGSEARDKAAHVILGPTVNLHRVPLAGRSFECYSEDPLLAARIAVAYVTGVQSTGVGCCIKHLVANDQEHERMTISAEVDERTLRELYLRPFEDAVREAGVWAVMTAYNRLNGTFCSEHGWLLRQLLKGEWGFDGYVMSDWFGTHSAAAVVAGLDLEMPGPPQHLGPRLLADTGSDTVDEDMLDEAVGRLLRLMSRTGALDDARATDDVDAAAAERSVDRPEVRAVARAAAAAALVLLRNDGVLPLDRDAVAAAGPGAVAVVGPNADVFEIQGGGSARVSSHAWSTPLEALRARLGEAAVAHEPGCTISVGIDTIDPRRLAAPDGSQGLQIEYRPVDRPDVAPVAIENASTTQLTWLGDPVPGLQAGGFAVRAVARFTPDVTGPWQLGLASAGRSRLLLDGEVVVDNWEPERGETFYGFGSPEVAVTRELTEGVSHDLVIELAAHARSPMTGVIAGAVPPLADDAMARAVAAAAAADVAVVVVGSNAQWETEGSDRTTLALPGRQDELVERVAAANPRTVVVVNAGAPVTMPWATHVGAVVLTWYPGEEGAEALADLLVGVEAPSGRLPTTFPASLDDVAAMAHYPGAGGAVRYGEGLLVGYRHHDTNDVAPLFCFGHGLSYTTFAYGDARLHGGAPGGIPSAVVVDVTNTGGRAGTEVVQAYLRHHSTVRPRPDKVLAGFARTTLEPGETATVTVALDQRSFAAWDVDAADWVVDPGEVDVLVGASSRDIRTTVAATLG